jgi:hypothetical protein
MNEISSLSPHKALYGGEEQIHVQWREVARCVSKAGASLVQVHGFHAILERIGPLQPRGIGDCVL